MANNTRTFTLGVKTTADLEGINKLKNALRELNSEISDSDSSLSEKRLGFDAKKINEASVAINILSKALNSSFDSALGGINFNKFQQSIKESGFSMQELQRRMAMLGSEGYTAFSKMTAEALKMNETVKYGNSLTEKLWATFKNTVTYTAFNALINTVSKTISRAVTYVQDLDSSLNDIRIVSGQSAEQMAEFAVQANEAAKALGSNTKSYTEAALIYYQQGLTGSQVTERTDVTTKMANVTGESAQQVSEDLTAIWNNFYDGSKSLEYYADVITALGAATASSTDEISEGLGKFAAIADTVGLSYEYATTALATVVAETRQSADTVGTAFKTLFARLQGLTLGETLDDGTDLNKYSQALAAVGISIKDQNGQLRNMDDILNDMGSKWQTLNKDQQVALAQTVAGTRQYTYLVSLMDKWETFQTNLNTATSAQGELNKQNNIYLESTEAHLKKLSTAAEDLYSSLFDNKTMNTWIDGLTNGVEIIDTLVESLGGLNNILPMLLAGGLNTFSGKIASGITNFVTNQQNVGIGREQEYDKAQYLANFRDTIGTDTNLDYTLTNQQLEQQVKFAADIYKYRSLMSKEEVTLFNEMVQTNAELIRQTSEMEEQQSLFLESDDNLFDKDRVDVFGENGLDTSRIDNMISLLSEKFADFEESIGELGTDEQISKAAENWLNKWEKSFTEAGIKVEDIREEIAKIGEDDEFHGIGSLKEKVNNTVTKARQLSNAMADVSVKTKMASEQAASLNENFEKRASIQQYIQLMSGAFALMQSIKMIGSGLEIIKEDNLSPLEIATQLLNNLIIRFTFLKKALASLGVLDALKTFDKTQVANAKALANAETKLYQTKKAYEEALKEFRIHKEKEIDDVKEYYSEFNKNRELKNTQVELKAKLEALEKEKDARERMYKSEMSVITSGEGLSDDDRVEISKRLPGLREDANKANNNYELAQKLAQKNNEALVASTERLNALREKETVATYFQESAQVRLNLANAKGAVISAENAAGEAADAAASLQATGAKKLLLKAQMALNAAWAANPIGVVITAISALVAVLSIGKKIYDEIYWSAERANEEIGKASEEYKAATDELDNLNSKIEDINTSLEELRNNGPISLTDKEEINRLESEKALLEAQLELQKQIQLEAAGNTVSALNEAFADNSYGLNNVQSDLSAIYGYEDYLTLQESDNSEEAKLVRDNIRAITGNYSYSDEQIQSAIDSINSMMDANNITLTSLENDVATRALFYEQLQNLVTNTDDAVQEQIIDKLTYQWDAITNYATDSYTDYFNKENYDAIQKGYEESQFVLGNGTKGTSEYTEAEENIQNAQEWLLSYYKINGMFGSLIQTATDKSLSENELNILKDTIEENNGEINLNEIKDAIGEENYSELEAYAEAYKISLEDLLASVYSYGVQISEQTVEVVDELSNQLNSVKDAISETDSGINSLLSGEELDAEAIQKIENSLYGLTNQYAELVAIRDKNSDAYLERLISIREELDAQAISLAKNVSASAYDALEETNFGNQETSYSGPLGDIYFKAHFDEAYNALNDFLDADYEITVAVKADLENDFQTATSQMEEASNMAQKIGDDFIVAGQDLRELNQQFPGILDGITYLEDGTAQLSQEAVETAIANSKAEGAAAAQAAIEKIQAEQQVLLAKASIYHQMGVIAQKGADNEELIEQSVSELKEQASRIDAINNKEVTQQKINNENEVADASAETGRAIVNNIGEAYRIAGQAADQFADEAIAALQSAITGEKVSVNSDYSMLNNYDTYQRDTSEGSQIYETTGISSLEEVEDTDQLKALADAYFTMEEELKASANDMSGMIAELAAGVNTIDTNNGKGSSSSDKKTDKDFDGSLDRYWDINKALDKINDAMDELEQKQSKLHGKELINSLKAENKLLEEQAKQYQLLAEEQDKELSEINTELESYGFKFNDNNEMQNYLAQYRQILNDMDNATTLYNAGIMNEETYNNASKEYENVKNLISRYDELINKRRENQKNIDENARKIKENNLEAWEVELEVKLDTKQAERDWNDFFGEINEDFKSIYTDFGNSFRVSMFDSTSLSHSVNDEIEAIKHIEKEIDKMKSGQDSNEYESISQAQDKLKELSEQMRDDAKEVFDLYKQGWEDYNSYIDEAINKFDKLTNQFERINEDLDHQAKLIELLYGQNDYDNLNSLYEVQKANLLGEMASLRDQANFFKSQYEELANVYGEDSDAAQKFKESWENAVDELHSKEEAYLETLANKYSNIIEKAFSSFEKQMAEGSSYDFISDQWDKTKEAAEDVFDEQERIYELQTLGNKYQKVIDKATTTSAQKKLTDLYESQVKSLEDKTRLTKYDVELAEKRLAVAEAEAALEDARNAKNTLKVTRGDDGNWSYQYVADDANVADKEQSLLDAQKEAYEYVKQNISDTKELMMTLAQDWSDTIKDLELKMIGATEEEKIQYQAMIDWYNEYYSTQMNVAGENLKNHERDLAVETNALLMAEYQVNADNYNLMTENQKATVDGLKQHMIQSTVDVYNATGETLDFIAEHGDEVMRETIDYFSTAASEITDAWANNPDSVKIAMEETLNECKLAMDEYTLSVKEGCISAGENFTEVGIAIDKDREAVNNLENATTELINNTIGELDLYGSYLGMLEELWNNVRNAIDSNYDSIQDYLKEIDTAIDDTLDLIKVLDEAAQLQYEIANGGNGPGRGGSPYNFNTPLEPNANSRYSVQNQYGDNLGVWDSLTNNWAYISGNRDAIAEWLKQNGSIRTSTFTNDSSAKAYGSNQALTGMTNDEIREIFGFDTGGYTGSWSNSGSTADNGKLAFLHSKELVLNQEDTKNILSAVDMIRNLTDNVQNNIQQAIANSILKALANLADLSNNNTTPGNISNIDSSQQNIFNINAEFPNAENVAEIQSAILGLPNAVSQYTGRSNN